MDQERKKETNATPKKRSKNQKISESRSGQKWKTVLHGGPCIRLSETKNSNIEVENVSKESISKKKSASVPKKCISKFVSRENTCKLESAPVPKESIGKPTSNKSVGSKNKSVPVPKESVSKPMSDEGKC